MDWLLDLITNRFFIVSVSSWFVAQFLKTVIFAIENKAFWRWRYAQRPFGNGILFGDAVCADLWI